MTTAVWVWLIVGALLVLSEFFATGVIAVFFGVGAWLTALAIALGLVESLAAQIGLFAVLSVLAVVLVRDKLKLWFRGHVSDDQLGEDDLLRSRGSRVTVTRAFRDGVGQVRLSGAEWAAEALDQNASYAEGETLWVVGCRGITLQVSNERQV